MIARYRLLARRIQLEFDELERTQATIQRHWMSLDLPDVRPPVLQLDTAVRLDEYRKFRHRVRNIYATNLDPDRMAPLVAGLPALWLAIRQDLTAFAAFLSELSGADTES